VSSIQNIQISELLKHLPWTDYHGAVRTNRVSKRALASEVWATMAEFSFGVWQRGHHFAVLKELGLTPGHLKVFGVLRPDETRPMGALADACACDASMATWLVDRLEDRGLVERRMVPTDRRVKAVALTPLGIQTRERLFQDLFDPPPELLLLDITALESLRRELAKLPITSPPFWASPARETRGPRRGVV
jgi:DNA-binding MarR family transcriptional regulator